MSQDWLHKERKFEESFYSSSRARIGITGFIFDCIAGKQEDEEQTILDLETGVNNLKVSKINNEEPIAFAFVSSTQIIAAAVSSITSGLTNLFSSWTTTTKQVTQQEKVIQNNSAENELFEVIIEGEMERTLQNIQKSYSQIKVATYDAPVSTIDSPKMNDISYSNISESLEKTQQSMISIVSEVPKAEIIDDSVETEDLWFSEDYEDSFGRSLSHSFYAMESYIDFKGDKEIIVNPIPKKNTKKASVKVHFEPMVELMDSVVNNDKAAVKKILQEGHIDVNDSDKLGYTMLHYAASRNHTDLIKYLVDKGADVNCLDLAHWTPLHLAAIADNYKACKTLLDLGANFEYPNEEGNMPVDLTEDAKVKKLLADATTKKLASKKVRAIYNWTAEAPECLSIKKSEGFKVLERKDQEWWLLQNDHKQIGLVPRYFVQ